jgi:hypothetical protein
LLALLWVSILLRNAPIVAGGEGKELAAAGVSEFLGLSQAAAVDSAALAMTATAVRMSRDVRAGMTFLPGQGVCECRGCLTSGRY